MLFLFYVNRVLTGVLLALGVLVGVLSQSPSSAQTRIYQIYRPQSERLILVPWLLNLFPDKTPPKIVSIDPGAGATNVADNKPIVVTFDEKVTTVNLQIQIGQQAPITVTPSLTDNRATWTPTTPYPPGAHISLSISATDPAANTLTNYPSGFDVVQTSSLPPTTGDTTPPAIAQWAPTGAYDYSQDIGQYLFEINTPIFVTFNEPVQPLQPSNLKVYLDPASPIAGNIQMSADQKTATLTPNPLLLPGKTYSAHVSGVKDPAGNTMPQGALWKFNTVPAWIVQWGATEGGACASSQCRDEGWEVETDTAGNIYVAGVTQGTQIPGATLGTFVTKFDPNTGDQVWSEQIESNTAAIPKGMAVGKNNDLYVSGKTTGSLDCSSAASASFSPSGSRVFLAKLDATTGACQWIKVTEPINQYPFQETGGVTVDSLGDIYILGSEVPFDPLNPFSAVANSHFIVWKFKPDGSLVWNKSFGQASRGYVPETIVSHPDSTNNPWVYLAGGRYNPADTTMNATLMKLNANGDLQWETDYLNSSWNLAQQLVVDNAGTAYLFGSLANSRVTPFQNYSVLLIAYDVHGTKISGSLVQKHGKTGSPRLFPIGAAWGSASNSLFLSGSLDDDYYLAKISYVGGVYWKKTFQTSGSDFANDMAIDSSGRLYVTGSTTGNHDGQWGPGPLGLEDAFLTGLDSEGKFLALPETYDLYL